MEEIGMAANEHKISRSQNQFACLVRKTSDTHLRSSSHKKNRDHLEHESTVRARWILNPLPIEVIIFPTSQHQTASKARHQIDQPAQRPMKALTQIQKSQGLAHAALMSRRYQLHGGVQSSNQQDSY